MLYLFLVTGMLPQTVVSNSGYPVPACASGCMTKILKGAVFASIVSRNLSHDRCKIIELSMLLFLSPRAFPLFQRCRQQPTQYHGYVQRNNFTLQSGRISLSGDIKSAAAVYRHRLFFAEYPERRQRFIERLFFQFLHELLQTE